MAGITKELNFNLINLNLSGHLWLVATISDSAGLEPGFGWVVRPTTE